jgi:hypothetical protein
MPVEVSDIDLLVIIGTKEVELLDLRKRLAAADIMTKQAQAANQALAKANQKLQEDLQLALQFDKTKSIVVEPVSETSDLHAAMDKARSGKGA